MFHAGVANAMVLFTMIAGVWGIMVYLRGRGVEGNYWGILAVGELTFVLQAFLGVILLLNNAQLERGSTYSLRGCCGYHPPGLLCLQPRQGRSASRFDLRHPVHFPELDQRTSDHHRGLGFITKGTRT